MEDFVVLRADRENLARRVSELLEENERLLQRTNPNHVVMVNGSGHYVNDSIKDAFEAQREAIEAIWYLSLVIESSVRRGDGADQYKEVLDALSLIKKARSMTSLP